MYESRRGSDSLRLTFSASTPNIDRAVAEVADFVSGLGPYPLFDIKLFLREALLNAVLHGCGQRPRHDCAVSCETRRLGEDLECVVSDQGPGFNWREKRGRIPPPEAESGRGLCIMEAYADIVEFNAAGNVVRLVKKQRGGPPAAAACAKSTEGKA